MSSRTRRTFTPEEKASVIRRHIVDGVPVSDLCEELKIQPGLFYLWQRQAMENLSSALQSGRGTKKVENNDRKLKEKVERLEAKLSKKDEVIAEVSRMCVDLKKDLGEL